MSDVLENTFSSLSRLLNENLISGISGSSPTNVKPQGCTKGFENFIRAVISARNKHEEDGIVKRELSLLQQRLSQPDVTTHQIKDYVVRVIYCCMLGHDINFARIHAIKLAQHGKLQEKRIGYLAASLLLHEDHELILLLINTIQKDLSSSNLLENCMGLMSICQLVNTEMAPMLLPSVIEKLRHPRAVVRKKAVMCLQKFHLKSPSSVQHLTDKFREALCDKNPGVMSSALHIYLELIQEDPVKHCGLVPGFVTTLTQIISRKLPTDYDYHAIPAPWIQIKLLRILAALGKGQQRASSLMYGVLKETLERATVKDNAAFAILYECVVTITTIWPDSDLLYTAASYVGKFLRSKGNNLRYAGLRALGHLVRSGPEFVTDYQIIVVECLDDPDEAIQKKTYDLLYEMTNSSNVEVICKRLIEYLVRARDPFVRTELLAKITQLLTNSQWYINTMNELMEVSSDQTPSQTSKSLLNTIQKGCSEADPDGQRLREFVVEIYTGYLRRTSLPPTLLSVTAWVLGEYCHSVPNIDSCSAFEGLVRHYQCSTTEENSRHYILTAIQKMFIHGDISTAKLHSVIDILESSTKGRNLRQRVSELKMLSSFEPELVHRLQPQTNGAMVDFTLSFLDDYVSRALEMGATAYKPRQIRLSEGNRKHTDVKSLLDEIQYERYSSSAGSPRSGNSGERGDNPPLGGSTDSLHSGSGKLEYRTTGINLTGVRRVWGKSGVVPTDTAVRETSSGSVRETDLGSSQRPGDLYPLQQQHSNDQTAGEERRKKEDLAAALFSGLGSSSSLLSTSEVSSRASLQENLSSPTVRDESYSSQYTATPFSLIDESKRPKSVEVLVKHIPSDGHDWRNFRKSVEEPGVSQSTVSNIDQAESSATRVDMEAVKIDPASDGDLHSRAVESLPTQDIGNSRDGSQMQEDFVSENSLVQETPVSLYDSLLGELTEEERLHATSVQQQHEQQKRSHAQEQS